MKFVKVKLNVWTMVVKKLKECMRAKRELNKQNREYNKRFASDKK